MACARGPGALYHPARGVARSARAASRTAFGGITRMQVAALQPRRHGLQPTWTRRLCEGVPS
jgi:hypothetical protein